MHFHASHILRERSCMYPIKQNKIYEIIMEEITNIIGESNLKPGDKLPSERDIATLLSVSRASVRQAISALISKGILISKQGDGTYVADTCSDNGKNIVEEISLSLASEQVSPVEIIEARRIVECEIARLCALRANHEIREKLVNVINKFDSYDPKKGSLKNLVNELHLTIAEGSNNRVLILMMKTILRLMTGNMWHLSRSIRPYNFEYSFDYHAMQQKEIVNAILSKNPDEAEKAMERFLDNIGDEMRLVFNDEKSRK